MQDLLEKLLDLPSHPPTSRTERKIISPWKQTLFSNLKKTSDRILKALLPPGLQESFGFKHACSNSSLGTRAHCVGLRQIMMQFVQASSPTWKQPRSQKQRTVIHFHLLDKGPRSFPAFTHTHTQAALETQYFPCPESPWLTN